MQFLLLVTKAIQNAVFKTNCHLKRIGGTHFCALRWQHCELANVLGFSQGVKKDLIVQNTARAAKMSVTILKDKRPFPFHKQTHYVSFANNWMFSIEMLPRGF